MVTKSMENVWSKVPGPECLFFLGNALPDMSDFYKLGASLPASLAGAFFFREKPGPYFYVCKTSFLCDFFGVEPTPKK